MQSVFYKTTPLIRSPGSHRQIFVAGLTKEGWGQGDQTSPFPDPLIPVPAPFLSPAVCPFAITCIFSVYPLYKCIENINTNKNLSSRSTMPRLNKREIRKRGYTITQWKYTPYPLGNRTVYIYKSNDKL